MRTQAMLKPKADLLELMRADRQVQNKRQAEQAAVDLEAARESILAGQDQARSLRGDAGPLVDSWVRAGRPFNIRFIETSGPDSAVGGKGQRSQCHRGSALGQVDYTVESDYIADLGGFPMGPRYRDRLQKAPAQSAPRARGRLRAAVREKFPALVI
jgi:hypothetical protein